MHFIGFPRKGSITNDILNMTPLSLCTFYRDNASNLRYPITYFDLKNTKGS